MEDLRIYIEQTITIGVSLAAIGLIVIAIIHLSKDENLDHIEIPDKYQFLYSELTKKWVCTYLLYTENYLYYDSDVAKFTFTTMHQYADSYNSKEDAQYDLRQYLVQEQKKKDLKNSYKEKQ